MAGVRSSRSSSDLTCTRESASVSLLKLPAHFPMTHSSSSMIASRAQWVPLSAKIGHPLGIARQYRGRPVGPGGPQIGAEPRGRLPGIGLGVRCLGCCCIRGLHGRDAGDGDEREREYLDHDVSCGQVSVFRRRTLHAIKRPLRSVLAYLSTIVGKSARRI